MIPLLSQDPESPFPAVELALENPRGLLAAGGDLSVTRLVNAYRHGIFPWYSEDEPILWWSPSPRCVLYPERVHISRRLRRRYNQGAFSVTADRAFAQVIEACAKARGNAGGTWITKEMQDAYILLHATGIAHSLEVWRGGELAGGVYGLALGPVFFGESMFSRVNDASKVALVALCRQMMQWEFTLLDCQVSNPHLLSMGAEEVSRAEFQQHLNNTDGADHWQQDFHAAPRW
ncbi:MAG: leucyl/phenylalanyl-tRNA--protein transferase [Gammaproteobacteria bacterium]|nr:MAG: leucyl/phenylalanyl-tRNA--protein transferase [Gammaproteobacteria bacterium]